MKSTLENPLDFFEYIIDEVNIKRELVNRLKFSDYKSIYIELPNVINYVEEDEFGIFSEGTTTVESELIPILRNQFEISRQLMKTNVLDNDSQHNQNFLRIQFNTIQNLVNRRAGIINKYPYLTLHLRGLVSYINTILSYPDMQKFELNEDGIHYEPLLGSSILKSDIEIIHEVLDYMKGENEKREIILSLEDFNLLIEYTAYLVENKKLPEVTRQIKPKLTNDAIRFSFYVIYKKLCYTKEMRQNFIQLIKLVFVNFKDNVESSIDSQFGTKSRVKADNFLPETILEHLKKS